MHWMILGASLLGSVSAAAPAPTAPPFTTAVLHTDNFPGIGVSIGDSPDHFNVVFDTGSSDFWINPAEIKTNSTTTNVTSATFDFTYGIGEARGHVAIDEVHIGDANQFNLTPTRTFGWADTLVSPTNEGGIIGMGLAVPTGDGGITVGWEMLQPFLQPPVIGVRMQHPISSSAPDFDNSGQFDFGGPDPQYVQQGITYSPVVESQVSSSWTIQFDGARVNGTDLGLLVGQQALLDTGSTGIAMTNADAAAVVGALGGGSTASGSSTTYYVPCDLGAQVFEVTIAGISYAVPNYLLIQGPSSDVPNGMCVSYISGHSDPGWVLGSGFLQAVYTVWDYGNKQVGFASVPPLTSTSSTTVAPTSVSSSATLPPVSSTGEPSASTSSTQPPLPPVSSTGGVSASTSSTQPPLPPFSSTGLTSFSTSTIPTYGYTPPAPTTSCTE